MGQRWGKGEGAMGRGGARAQGASVTSRRSSIYRKMRRLSRVLLVLVLALALLAFAAADDRAADVKGKLADARARARAAARADPNAQARPKEVEEGVLKYEGAGEGESAPHAGPGIDAGRGTERRRREELSGNPEVNVLVQWAEAAFGQLLVAGLVGKNAKIVGVSSSTQLVRRARGRTYDVQARAETALLTGPAHGPTHRPLIVD